MPKHKRRFNPNEQNVTVILLSQSLLTGPAYSEGKANFPFRFRFRVKPNRVSPTQDNRLHENEAEISVSFYEYGPRIYYYLLSLLSLSVHIIIIYRHSWLGNKAVKQLEAALSSLEQACTAWTRRAALACVPDLEALCVEHLKQPHDWEVNFKACKAYGQAIAKMTL